MGLVVVVRKISILRYSKTWRPDSYPATRVVTVSLDVVVVPVVVVESVVVSELLEVVVVDVGDSVVEESVVVWLEEGLLLEDVDEDE